MGGKYKTVTYAQHPSRYEENFEEEDKKLEAPYLELS